ncbi:glycoside hydrolase family 32 protein [Glycomyces rhizosphaerae]|uniref:Glycoside hydrolase family 32 protein n=1 Tax=Glycomyces rhizosphaerae TaxID=2054422 RepID=A0ABV7PZ60_9ACTN
MIRTSRKTVLRALGLGAAAAVALPTAASAAPKPGHGYTAAASSKRPEYHFAVPDGWKNDPQRPIWVDGKYLYYYLYNADYGAAAEGTAWRLASSTDNLVYTDEGVAIPKDANADGDVWSGCAVIDTENTAGFGAGAVVVLATQEHHASPADADQAQFLWYSTDDGRSFTALEGGPVLANPGVRDFRDPKVFWDEERSRWAMALAEGNKIGFYHSPDLKAWTYAGGFFKDGLGALECPDLFWLDSDTGPGRWVLGLSANGKGSGLPCTYAYWTGDFDGANFTADQAEPQWLDHGWDWYGAVTWEKIADGQADAKTRYARAWMNFWDYPHETLTWESDGFNGTDSITREISLKWYSDTDCALVSRPVAALDDRVAQRHALGDIEVDGHLDLDFTGLAYEIQTSISWTSLENVGLQLRRSNWGSRHIDVGKYGDFVYVNRAFTWNPDRSARWHESRTPHAAAFKQVYLRILVDRTSIEVFVDDGRRVHSHLVFPEGGDNRIALYAHGGPAVFGDFTIIEYEPI